MFLIQSIVLSLLLLAAPGSYQKVKLGEKASIKLPEGFYPMTEQDYREKYLSTKMPIASYTDQERANDFFYNIAANEWQDKDISLLLKFNKSSIVSMHTKVDFLMEQVIENSKTRQQQGVLEYVSTMSDKRGSVSKYHYQVYIVVKRKIHIFTLIVPISFKDKWQPEARKFMQTAYVSR